MKTATEATTAQAANRPTEQVELQQPIERAGQTITTLGLMKPRVGDLRGLSLNDIVSSNTDAIATLLPRISVPTLIKSEVENLDLVDLMTIAGTVVGFFLPQAVRESLSA